MEIGGFYPPARKCKAQRGRHRARNATPTRSGGGSERVRVFFANRLDTAYNKRLAQVQPRESAGSYQPQGWWAGGRRRRGCVDKFSVFITLSVTEMARGHPPGYPFRQFGVPVLSYYPPRRVLPEGLGYVNAFWAPEKAAGKFGCGS
jgi:hypothetical protein